MAELYAPRIYTAQSYAKREPFLGDGKYLDVGCGTLKLPGAVGMDILSLPTVDVVHNADITPWPLEDNTFDLVFMNHALEHVVDVVSTMGEVHRILKPGGHAVIQVPYFRDVWAFNDPTHKHFFTSTTLDYFVKGTSQADYHYNDKLFTKSGFWFGYPHPSSDPLRQKIKEYIHAHAEQYDRFLSRIYPSRVVTWELEKPL